MIVVDGEQRYCDQTTLNFVPFPKSILIGEQSVLKVAIPHHFSSKLDFLNSDMRSISIFQNTNFTDPHFGNKVINFFQTAKAIHWSFTFILFLCILLLATLICCACYIRCPACLLHAFCCWSNTCCLKRRVRTREQQQKNYATEMQPMPSHGDYHPPPQNPQPQPQQPYNPYNHHPQHSQVAQYNCKNGIFTCNCLQSREPCKQL